jgi:hypothetical protein
MKTLHGFTMDSDYSYRESPVMRAADSASQIRALLTLLTVAVSITADNRPAIGDQAGRSRPSIEMAAELCAALLLP